MKSQFPYLTDIGVSNFCRYKCKMCYTESTPQGKMGDGHFLTYTLPKVLKEANVLNAVMGGGETTLYKDGAFDISTILQEFHSRQFVTGVTTRNYNLHKISNLKKFMENCDSLAISCNSIEDLEKTRLLKDKLINKTNEYYINNFPKIYIQNILELKPYEELKEFIKKCKELGFWNLTLLGYKRFGFGKNQEPYEIPDEWIEYVRDVNINIGIDSILVNKYREKLIAKGVKDYYLVGAEGQSSCYINAAQMYMSPSSFSDVKFPITQNLTSKEFLEIFSKF